MLELVSKNTALCQSAIDAVSAHAEYRPMTAGPAWKHTLVGIGVAETHGRFVAGRPHRLSGSLHNSPDFASGSEELRLLTFAGFI